MHVKVVRDAVEQKCSKAFQVSHGEECVKKVNWLGWFHGSLLAYDAYRRWADSRQEQQLKRQGRSPNVTVRDEDLRVIGEEIKYIWTVAQEVRGDYPNHTTAIEQSLERLMEDIKKLLSPEAGRHGQPPAAPRRPGSPPPAPARSGPAKPGWWDTKTPTAGDIVDHLRGK